MKPVSVVDGVFRFYVSLLSYVLMGFDIEQLENMRWIFAYWFNMAILSSSVYRRISGIGGRDSDIVTIFWWLALFFQVCTISTQLQIRDIVYPSPGWPKCLSICLKFFSLQFVNLDGIFLCFNIQFSLYLARFFFLYSNVSSVWLTTAERRLVFDNNLFKYEIKKSHSIVRICVRLQEKLFTIVRWISR